MKVHILQKVELAVLGFAALIAIAAMVFYFTRDWIQFSPAALLWLPYPLLPYVVLGGVGYLLNRRKKLLRRAVITLAGSLVLLGFTILFYVPFMHGTLVFYLSWALGMSGILLGGVAIAFLLLSWLSGAGIKAAPSDILIPEDTPKYAISTQGKAMLQTQDRSDFVTTIAWIFIVISGFSIVIVLLHNIMHYTAFYDLETLRTSPPKDMPPVMVFIANHTYFFIVAFLIVPMFTCISSIGLLKRWNPARLCFIGIMGLGILYNFGGLALLQFSIFSSIQEQFSAGSPSDAHVAFVIVIMIMIALFAIGFSILFGWIAKRLLSPEIVVEFQR